MILLAIDTATECCSAALWVKGKVFSRSSIKPRMHAEIILPFIDEILIEANIKKSDIQGLIVGQGPGAFTGVRIGVAVAQGLALALNIPIVAVSNLKALAYSCYQLLHTKQQVKILVASDARMSEVYSALYSIKDDCIKQITDEAVGNAEDLDLTTIDYYIGSGFSVYPALIHYAKENPVDYDTNVFSHAKDMLMMVKDNFNTLASSIETIEPVYLREP